MSSLTDELARRLGISKAEFEAKVAQRKAETRSAERLAAEEQAAEAHLAKAPRYPGARSATLAEARTVLAQVPPLPANPGVDGLFDPETFTLPSVQIVDGPLELPALELLAGGSHLFVRGSLTVHGMLRQEFRAGHLLVLGDLRAKHLVTTSELACIGALEIEGVLYGNCTNYSTNVWGPARADVILSAKEHAFCFWAGVDARIIVDLTGGAPNLAHATHHGDTMHQVLHPELGDGYDELAVATLLRRRGTVLR